MERKSEAKKTVWQMIEATGEHSYGEWTVTKEASCTERGKQEKDIHVRGSPHIGNDTPAVEAEG